MVATVGSYHHWPPKEYESLYLDDADFFGLRWWYNQIIEEDNKLKAIKDKANG